MSFRLGTIFYVFALLAAGLATFGAAWGIIATGAVLAFWGWMIYGQKPQLGWLQLVFAVLVMIILLALLLPSVQSARQASRRATCANNLKHIVLGLLNYETARGTLPPAFRADAAGTPMHSWRVLILPYMEEAPLYLKYRLNEPWNGPNNSKLASFIPEVYRCPGDEHETDGGSLETNYFAVVGPQALFPGGGKGRGIRTVTDGTSRTIAVIEARGLGVNWMEPRDLTIDKAVELLTTKQRSGHRHVDDGFLTTTYYETSERHVAFCDGSVHWFGQLSDAEIAKALLTAVGGEILPQNMRQSFVPPKTTTVVKWGKVWGLLLFVVLSVLPVWMKRGAKAEAVRDLETAALGDASENEFVVVNDTESRETAI